MVPGINLWLFRREGAGSKTILVNLSVGLAIAVIASLLVQVTGELLQWIALAIGLYCAFSWVQMLICRDPVCFSQIFRCKTVCYVFIANGCSLFAGASMSLWMIPYFQRHFSLSVAEVGTVMGLSTAIAGLIGVIMGGVLADKLRQRIQRGKLYVAVAAWVLTLLSALILLTTSQVVVAYACAFISMLFGSMIAAPLSATVNDLMIPRTRATAMALYIMTMNFGGVALGPYIVGLLSDNLVDSGVGSGQALRQAMLMAQVFSVVGLVLLVMALRHLPADEDNRLERARALGEVI